MSRSWINRYEEFKWIFCMPSSVDLKDSLEEWIEGTGKLGKDYKPKLYCEICDFLVTTTCINDFVGKRNILACKCNNRIKWILRYIDFKNYCDNNNYELLDTEEEWKKGCREKGKNYKPRIKCKKCDFICNTTTIESAFYNNILNCECPNITHWIGKRDKFITVCEIKECELLDDEKTWNEGTSKYGIKYKPTIKCLKCNSIFTTTRILEFINLNIAYGCICGRVNEWQNRISEIKDECKNRNTELQIDDIALKEELRKEGKLFKPPIKCKKCEIIVTTTSIDVLMYKKSLGCRCKDSRSETLMCDILKKLYPENTFKKVRPQWLRNSHTGANLELDAYCEELKLAFEYNGLQHDEFIPHFHNNNIENFKNLQLRDKKKIELCIEHKIKLIIIPSEYSYQNPTEMGEFIKECCVKNNKIDSD